MKKKLLDNAIIYMITSILLIVLGQFVGSLIVALPMGAYGATLVQDISAYESAEAYSAAMADAMPASLIAAETYLIFIGIWIIALLWFLKPANRPLYHTLTKRLRGNRISMLLLGFLLGFLLNAFCILIASLHGDIQLTFYGIEPISLILIFVMVFIQSSAEELICRGYLYQKLLHRYHHPMIAMVGNAALFAVLHLLNNGVTVLSVINIFLCGMAFSLLVYATDSLWIAMAAHTAWNFTQNIIFGLPNSGIKPAYSMFLLNQNSARNSFAYDTGFGIEGTLVVTILFMLICIVLYLYSKKHYATTNGPTNIWEDYDKAQQQTQTSNEEEGSEVSSLFDSKS